MVAPLDDHAGFRRLDLRRPQRQSVQPCFRDREHGGPPARRIFPDAHVQEARSAYRQGGSEVTMEVQAITHNIRMSAQKMREVVRQIQGLPAAQAQAVLAFVPRKGARVVAKTLKSAMANAEDLKMHKEEYRDINTD